MKIDACQAEGLACRFDAEAGGCVVPGCAVGVFGSTTRDDTTMSGSEATIAPIDARRWRLNTVAHAGEPRSRVIAVAPSKLEPLARCAAP